MDPMASEIINDPVIRAQFDAALASNKPLVARPGRRSRMSALTDDEVREAVTHSDCEVSEQLYDEWLLVNNGELALLRALEEAVREAWDAYDDGLSAKRAIRRVGKALGWE